jgi:hypothetical protein
MIERETIFGKKERNQILRDSENRFIVFVVGHLLLITGIILLIVLSGGDLEPALVSLVLLGSVGLALILVWHALKCPFCDSVKWYARRAGEPLPAKKNTFVCYRCKLTDEQISEILDLLKRGVEITPATIARFNRREL